MKYPQHLLQLFQALKKLPGVGTKSAERFAFQMLAWPEKQLREMARLIETLPEKLAHCEKCGCLLDEKACYFCESSEREKESLCLLASAKDVFALEETREYKGLYHILGTLLSPMEGKGPEHLGLERLKQRITALGVKEVIIALDSTLEGDATALYLKKELSNLDVILSRLAFGLPMGSSLEYVDGGTLTRALQGRRSF